MGIYVKACGFLDAENALAAALCGVDALGLNFVEGSKRYVTPAQARTLRERVLNGPGLSEQQRAQVASVEWVGVVADMDAAALLSLKDEVGLNKLQLHGDESPELLAELGDVAYKAVRVASAADVEHARRFGGERILVDAKVDGALGGTGHAFDWTLVEELAKDRQLVLAGGLNPQNITRAVSSLRPFGVDVASGVESAPGIKDPTALREFVERARRA